jgi:hypothetical protein
MPDSLSKAKRFRDRAEECRRLSELSGHHEISHHYARITQHYIALAEAEEKLAGRPPPPLLE